MSARAETLVSPRKRTARGVRATERNRPLSVLLIGAAVAGLLLLVVLPLVEVFAQALHAGVGAALHSFSDPYTLAAIRLTLTTTLIVVVFNSIFGVLAAWTIAKYHFPGKALLMTAIDLPLTVSPVVAGLAILLVFGSTTIVGGWLSAHGIKVAFAPAGIAIATIFVTFPYIARELIASMQERGRELEEASFLLGASLPQTLARVTLPSAKWAFFNGLLLCNARAMGEFGAVSVISGRIRGLTDTVPLHIEILYNEYDFVAAFALAALLSLATIALTLVRALIERAERAKA